MPETLSNVRADAWEVKKGGTLLPHWAELRLPVIGEYADISSRRFGRNTIGSLLVRNTFEFTLTFEQSARDEVLEFFNIGSGAAPRNNPAIGAQPGGAAFTLHDPADGAVTTGDITLFNVTAVGAQFTSDNGKRTLTVTFRAHADPATGLVFRVGPAT